MRHPVVRPKDEPKHLEDTLPDLHHIEEAQEGHVHHQVLDYHVEIVIKEATLQAYLDDDEDGWLRHDQEGEIHPKQGEDDSNMLRVETKVSVYMVLKDGEKRV